MLQRACLLARTRHPLGGAVGNDHSPCSAWDTRLGLRFRDTHTEIVERPFDDLDIEASSRTLAVSLTQPVCRSEEDELWLELVGEYRETESRVFGTSFCFELTEPKSDEPTAAIVRAALGLAGVALRSGARSALGTLWSVNDAAAAELITRSYQELADGASRAQALQRAQLQLLEQRGLRHPAYWAPSC